jgi:4-alpha-glucanotransferase
MSTDTFHFQPVDVVDTSQEKAASRKAVRFPRASGILLHPTSLPGPHGIGDLGKEAFQFVDFLAENQQQLWQVLPLNPPGMGESPYAAFSAFAGNPLLVSLERLGEMGLLTGDQLAPAPGFPAQRVDYAPVRAYKLSMLQRACDRLNDGASGETRGRFEAFRAEHADWLDDFALFMALKDAHRGEPWTSWERPLVTRQPQALEEARRTLSPAIRFHQSLQFIFFT